MTITDDTTFGLFQRAALGDGDRLDYPPRISFLSEDLPGADDVLWRNLHDEYMPTVIVTRTSLELLITPVRSPLPVRIVNKLRGRMTVRVSVRQHDDLDAGYAIRTQVGHRPLTDIRSVQPAHSF